MIMTDVTMARLSIFDRAGHDRINAELSCPLKTPTLHHIQ